MEEKQQTFSLSSYFRQKLGNVWWCKNDKHSVSFTLSTRMVCLGFRDSCKQLQLKLQHSCHVMGFRLQMEKTGVHIFFHVIVTVGENEQCLNLLSYVFIVCRPCLNHILSWPRVSKDPKYTVVLPYCHCLGFSRHAVSAHSLMAPFLQVSVQKVFCTISTNAGHSALLVPGSTWHLVKKHTASPSFFLLINNIIFFHPLTSQNDHLICSSHAGSR